MRISHLQFASAACVLAVITVFAITAGTAWAAPKGEIVNRSGKAPVKDKFTSEYGETLVENVGGARIECRLGKGKGTVTSTTTAVETVTFEGCETGTHESCHTEEAPAGVVQGEFKIAWLPSEEKSYLSMTFGQHAGECGGNSLRLVATALVAVPVEHEFNTRFTFIAEQEGGFQEPTEYEFDKKLFTDTLKLSLLGPGKLEQAGISTTQKIFFEEEVEFL
jgi:hypothetical protein